MLKRLREALTAWTWGQHWEICKAWWSALSILTFLFPLRCHMTEQMGEEFHRSQSLQIPSFLTYAKHMRVQAHLLSLLRIEALMEVFLRGKINQQGRLNVNVHGHICDIHSCMHVLLGSIGFSENRDKHSCLNEVNTYTQRSYWLIHWANSNKECSIMHWYLHLLCVTTKRINGCWFSFMSLSTFLKMRMHKSDLCLNLRKQVRSKSV